MGARAVHLGAKIPVVRRALSSTWAGPADHDAPRLLDEPFDGDPDAGRDRRRFLVLVGSSAALLTAVTVGQTVRPLQRLALLAPRRPDVGPQGFPVNKTAAEAGVGPEDRAAYRLVVTGAVATELELTLDDLRAMPPCPSPASRAGARPSGGAACGWPISWPSPGRRRARR